MFSTTVSQVFCKQIALSNDQIRVDYTFGSVRRQSVFERRPMLNMIKISHHIVYRLVQNGRDVYTPKQV